MMTNLLRTKILVPSLRPDLVARPRLSRRLDESLLPGSRLVLLCAPAGFGKTTLLADWLSARPRSACWLSLDAADNAPARFLSYVIAAMQQAIPGVGSELIGPLRSGEPPSAESVLGYLVNELTLAPDDLTLVLDDYHAITSPAVNSALTFLVENLPPNLRLVIASRADPPIPIARLRSRGQVVEIRADELRFTPEEAAAFLGDTMGLTLSAEQVAALDERAEGWIAGLQMAALSMRDRADVDAFIQSFTGTHRFILDFLVEEVLSREEETVQRFLMRTALLHRLCGPLCDAVTGGSDGQEMLESLERRNLFVAPLDDQRHWYRYHHLFADLLQARQRQEGPAETAPLLSRAAAWCQREGQIAEAAGYAIAAKDFDRLAKLVARYWGPIANSGEIDAVWSWLAALPAEMVRGSAQLSVARCWLLWLKGQIDAIEPHLVDAEAALGRPIAPESGGPPDGGAAELSILVAALRSIVARYRGDFADAVRYAERTRTLIPENLPDPGNTQIRGLVAMTMATALDGMGELTRAVDAYREAVRLSRLAANPVGISITYRMASLLQTLGRLNAAEAACREALQFLDAQGMARLPAAGVLHLALAELAVERNDLDAAEERLSRGSELGKGSGRLDAVRNAAPALSRLRLARGDARGAVAAVDEAESAQGEQPSPLARAELLSLRAGILARQGVLAEAADCVDEAERLAGHDRGQTGSMVVLAALRVHLADQSRFDQSETMAQLSRALAAAEESGRLGWAIELRVLRCLAFREQGAGREADLRQALAMAEPEGYVRVFVDEGEPMAELLRALAARSRRSSEGDPYSAGYLTSLLAAFGGLTDAAPAGGQPASGVHDVAPPPRPLHADRGKPPGQSPALIEPLSERELEVLGLMAEGLTNQQIANRLIIALGTVKAHIHNITGKLGAQNRAHAVALAQELDLL